MQPKTQSNHVANVLMEAARQWPEKPAVIDNHGAVDFKTLWRAVDRLTTKLQSLGVKPRQGIGVMGQNSRSFIICALAASKCGAVVMPMSHQLKQNEVSELLNKAPLFAIIDDRSGLQPVSGSSDIIEIDNGLTMRFAKTGVAPQVPLVDVVPDAAFVRFTSGTTGKSKGVVITHQGVLDRTASANKGLCLSPNDRVLWVLPMAFHFFVSIILYLRYGAAIIINDNNLAESMIDTANKHSASLLYASPFYYHLLSSVDIDLQFTSLEKAISTSFALPAHIEDKFRRRFGIPITQAYGIIEVGLPLMNAASQASNAEAVGRPLPDFDVAILDENLATLPAGSIGQLAIKGPGMFAAYLDPPLPLSEVLRNGWFLTGDLARQDDTGLVTVCGRKKSMINVSGSKVFPEEVEHVLLGHPGIKSALVYGRSHSLLGEIVHADIVLDESEDELDTEQVIAYCKKRLSSPKPPQSIKLVECIETTPSGKIRRK